MALVYLCVWLYPTLKAPVYVGPWSNSANPFMALLTIAQLPIPKLPVLYGTHQPWSFVAWVSGNSEYIKTSRHLPMVSMGMPYD